MKKDFYFNEYRPTVIDFENKEDLIKTVVNNFIIKLQSMFEWKNLPVTIPQRALEMTIQVNGSTNIFKWGGELYQSIGNIGGGLNYNYMPRLSIVSNPYIKGFNSKTLKIYYGKDDVESTGILNYDGECVVIPNDNLYIGVMPIVNFYAQQYVENVISKRIATINSRALNIFIAPDENTKKDFETFVSELVNGKLKAIISKNIFSNAQTVPFGQDKSNGVLSDLIEDQQYIKASWLNEFGLNANYNMKREAINSNESQLNQDALLPLPDQMLLMRQQACKLVNEKFGTNWSVDFSSAWKNKREEIERAIDSIDSDNEDIVQETELENDNEEIVQETEQSEEDNE